MSELMWKIAEGDLYAKFIINQDLRFQAAMREELEKMANDRGLRLVRKPETEPEPETETAVAAIPQPDHGMIEDSTPHWKRIRMEVCQKHGIALVDLIGERRDRLSAKARHEAFYRMRHETTMSLPAIGRRMGGRDHTTVMNGIKRHEMRMNGEA